ncbi:MAG TPA: ABC transporter permease [Kofleriaceae bacterium]|nr:ABC transporter permease [Kofleriaceae bacterium]
MAHRSALIGAVLCIVLVLIALVGPLLAPDPLALDIDHGLTELGAPKGPSLDAPLGTDSLGRDVWARVAAGAGTSLWIAFAATLLAIGAGVAVGLVAGYRGGRVDELLMRLADLALAFPFLLLAILLAALLRESAAAESNAPVIVPLAIVGWTTFARVVRAKARVLARSEYVAAARALGASPVRVIVHHVLPNLAGVIVVAAAFGFAQNLLAESALSFLGLGPPPPAPTWGRMLFEGRAYYRTAPWLVIAPGVAIVLAVVAFNLLGEGLRERLDPRGRR